MIDRLTSASLIVLGRLALVLGRRRYFYLRHSLPDDERGHRRSTDCRRRSTSSATRTPFHISTRATSSTRCSDWATSTPRIDCGRWSFSAASDSAGSRRFSAPPRCPRTGFCARSGSAVRPGRPGPGCRHRRNRKSTPTSPASTRFSAAHHGSALPPEFTLLRFEPEPWTGADVVVWQKMMAWDLSANYSFELLRHDIDRQGRRSRHSPT